MRLRCVAGTVVVFGAGMWAGLAVAASVAKAAGCPAASGEGAGLAQERARAAGAALADAVDEVVKNLENLRQRRESPGDGGRA